MNKRTLASLVALAMLLTLLTGLALAQDSQPFGVTAAPPDTHTGTNVVIHYYECSDPPDAGDPADCISDDRAELLADQLDESWDAYLDYGFNAPFTDGAARLPVWVFSPLHLNAWGWSMGDHIEVDPVRIQAIAASTHLGTPHHELFHQVQRTYGNSEPGWVVEGTAKFIEDMIFADLDAFAASAFVGRANNYLNAPNRLAWNNVTSSFDPGGLLDADYDATLIWKFLTERYGDVTDAYFGAEPQYGIDWLVDFWEEVDTFDGISAINAALPGGENWEKAFQQFLVTNYLKRLNVTNDYRYVDDPGPAYNFDPIHVEYGTELLPMSHNNERVEDWGAIYYVGDPPAAGCPFVQVELDGDPGDSAFYAVFAIDGANAIYHDHPGFRTVTNDWTKTIVNDSLGTVVAVVGGMSNPADFSISMECVTPTLNILEPLTDLYAQVGDPDQPRRMMVYAEVTGDGGESFVEGLTWEDFEVSIGGKPVDDLITGAYVQSQYWLIVQPPTQTVTGDPPWEFDLDVTLEGLSDSETDAVHYEPLPHYDEVLVIDTSGSMQSPAGYPKLLAAQNAAKLYVDELADDDQMGAVEFNTVADPLWDGLWTVNNGNRNAAATRIENLSTTGCTSIGDGLLKGLTALEDGSDENPDVIILLSDGMENTSPCWEEHEEDFCPSDPYHDCTSGPYVRDQVVDADVIVHTVALGTGAHEDLMQRIADETDGRYRFATLPSSLSGASVQERPAAPGLEPPLGAVSTDADTGDEWAYRLSGIYDFLEGEVEGRERILVKEGSQTGGGTPQWDYTYIYLDETVSHATFSIAYEQYTVLNGSGGDLARIAQLRPPNRKTPLPPTYSDDYHDVFEVSSPAPGIWTVEILIYQTGPDGAAESQSPAASPYKYQVMVSGQSGLAVEVQVGTPHQDRYLGLCVPIFATFLGPSGIAQNAGIEAMVTTPTPTDGQIPVTLQDDGNHGDGAPGDGIYGGQFCRTSAPGSYTINLVGRIEAMAGTIFRRATASFHVQPDGDDDNDGQPNKWEEENGLNPNVADDDGNPDLDFGCPFGCYNFVNDQELSYGTDPNNDDTDGGGEMDYSEILHSQDPTSGPGDDQVEVPTSFRVTPGTEENIITYDLRQGETYWLLWSIDPAMGDLMATGHRLNIGATGVFSHTGLTNGTTYYYLLVAVKGTHISGFADMASATPALDPTPPWGDILINGGAESTLSQDVTLDLGASPDTVEMLLSNTPGFEDAAWEPYAAKKDWRISPGDNGAAFVYALFRDGADNVSQVAVDGILSIRIVYLPIVLRNYP